MLRFEITPEDMQISREESLKAAREVRRGMIRDSMERLEYHINEDLRSMLLHLQSLYQRQKVHIQKA